MIFMNVLPDFLNSMDKPSFRIGTEAKRLNVVKCIRVFLESKGLGIWNIVPKRIQFSLRRNS